MHRGATFANAARWSGDESAEKTTNLSLGSTAVRRVILAAEPHVSLTPTMLLWCLALVLGYGFDEV